jgi:hypothetical protein
MAALLVLCVVTAYAASDATPNLGSVKVTDKTSIFVDARIFDTAGDQGTLDNTVWSIGFKAPIDTNLEFGFMYSGFDVTGPDPIAGNLRESYRKVVSPNLKFGLFGSDRWSLDLGADIAINQTFAANVGSSGFVDSAQPSGGSASFFKAVTPAVRLNLDLFKIGALRVKAAGQMAAWDTLPGTNGEGAIEGFGTVYSLGGGVAWPWGKRLTIVGDAMYPLGGNNYVNEDTGNVDRELVWSAGANWAAGRKCTLGAYATNAMGPTLAASTIGSPANGIALGINLTHSF